MFLHPHFTITKDKTHYVRLTAVFAVAGFVAIMAVALPIIFSIDIENSKLTPLSRRGATLSLQADRTEVRTGEVFDVAVLLASSAVVTGADVVVQYDPTRIALEPRDPNAATPAERYLGTALSVLDIFPYAETITGSESSSSFAFSALVKPLRNFKGQGEVASLRFRALRSGEAAVSILFEPHAGSDSNVASQGKDVLTGVRNLTVTIQ